MKFVEDIKTKYKFFRKSYLNCNVAELNVKKRYSYYLSLSFVATSLILIFEGFDIYFRGYGALGIILIVVGNSYLFASIDQGNDVNRINMWIYLKWQYEKDLYGKGESVVSTE